MRRGEADFKVLPMHPGKLLMTAAAVLAIAPATASAATISMEGETLAYKADPSEGIDLLLSSRQVVNPDGGGWLTYLSFHDTGRDSLVNTTGGYCFTPEDDQSALLCRVEARRPILIEGSEVKDGISIGSPSDVPATIPVTIRAKGGDDVLKDSYGADAGRIFDAGAGNDKVEAYQGNDVIDGGDGNDDLNGGGGSDEVRAGNGDDKLAGDQYDGVAPDLMDGGAGTDSVDEWTNPGSGSYPQPTVSLDGVANDGRPGEGDNVVGIEKFTSHVSMVFTGTDAPENVEIANPGDELPSSLVGHGGNDVLTAYDFDDRLDGGTGDDRLFGGFGNDTIVGGPGKDTIYGDQTTSYCGGWSCKVPFGNDTIDAADGEADQVDCGVGEDTAKVDAIDTVVNCEKVDKQGAGPGPGPETNNGQATNNGASIPVTVVGKTNRGVLKQGRLALQLDCAAACRVTATASVGKKTAKKLGLKGTTLATGTKTLLQGGKAKVQLKLAKAAKKRLGKVKGALAVSVKLTVTGADGAKQVVTKKLTIK